MCTKKLASKLNLASNDFKTSLSVVTGSYVVKGQKIEETKVYNKSLDDFVVVKDILTIDSIPVSSASLFKREDLQGFAHLEDVCVPEGRSSDEIDMLIGSGVPKAFHQLEERKGEDDEMYAVRQTLGWDVVGPKQASNVTGSHSFLNSESVFLIHDKQEPKPE